MPITCPHCTTSYAVDPAKFGPGGRTVRCARCHETWLARPEEVPAEMVFAAPIQQHADAGGTRPRDDGAARDRQPPPAAWQDDDAPHIESPPIAGDWGVSEEEGISGVASNDGWADEPAPAKAHRWLKLTAPIANILSGMRPLSGVADSQHPARRLTNEITLPRACVVMGAVALALVIWRTEVVRLMPQTAEFFKMTGLGVNLRGLTFEGLKITSETVNGKPVLVIEGAIASIARKPVELARLRFSVRDEQGSDIYAWNSMPEQPVLNPGERIRFKSRLASPPAEGREIVVRFFQRRDIVAGGA